MLYSALGRHIGSRDKGERPIEWKRATAKNSPQPITQGRFSPLARSEYL